MKFTLGNYVYLFAWQGEPPNSVKVRVETSLGLSDLYGILSGAMAFEPIPLTEEWLLKFGFDRDKIHDFSFNTGYVGMWADGLGNFDIEIEGQQLGLNQIKYVHQLQNLYFALTGEELTIK